MILGLHGVREMDTNLYNKVMGIIECHVGLPMSRIKQMTPHEMRDYIEKRQESLLDLLTLLVMFILMG